MVNNGKKPTRGEIEVWDPIMTLEAAKIKMLQKPIAKDRQPWMWWIERKLTQVANLWKIPKAMAARPTCKQRKALKSTCLTESTLGIWFDIGGTKRQS